MEPRDLEQIEKFLGDVGKDSLFTYYGVHADDPDDAVKAAIRKRRGWAQGQQANPKYRAEAMWIIKQNLLIRRVLLENRRAYAESVDRRSTAAGLEALTPFIQGILAAGPLTPEGRAAILSKGREQGLSQAAVREHLRAVADLPAAAPVPDEPPEEAFVDYYELLEVAPSSDFEELEAAYRAKYRWARNLRDRAESARIYDLLDLAWRALETPEKRAEYDALRARHIAPPSSPAGERAPAATGVDATSPRPPPPPEGLGARTLGLGKKPTGRRPRLAITSPELVQVKTGRSTINHQIVIKNTGQGRMPGRVSSDRKWLEVSRSRLDPDTNEQEIEVTIHPGRMPRRRAIALVSIITDHGERRAITFRVERRSLLVPLLGVVALLLAILLITQLTTRLGVSP